MDTLGSEAVVAMPSQLSGWPSPDNWLDAEIQVASPNLLVALSKERLFCDIKLFFVMCCSIRVIGLPWLEGVVGHAFSIAGFIMHIGLWVQAERLSS